MAITEEEFKQLEQNVRRNKVGLKDEEFPDVMVKKPLKYRNTPIATEDGYFHSTSEKNRWEALKFLQDAGQIHTLQRQVKIEVCPSVFWEQKGQFLAPIFWVADFLYFDNNAQKWVVEDWKSPATAKLPEYKLKRQLCLERYSNFVYRETGIKGDG